MPGEGHDDSADNEHCGDDDYEEHGQLVMKMRMLACLNKLVSRVIYCMPGGGHFNAAH